MEKVQIITILIFLIAQTTVYGFPIGKSAEEMSGNFEGDMELEAGQLRNVMMKVGLTSDHYRWLRNRHGTVVVPYTIRDGSPYSEKKMFHNLFTKTWISFYNFHEIF